MKQALPPLTKDLLEAFAASAVAWLAWLVGVVVTLGAPQRSRRLRRFVEVAERTVESIMFLEALHRSRLCGASPRPSPRRRRFPRPAPSGFRRAGPYRRRRQFFRDSGVCARRPAGFCARLAHLMSVLADPEPHVAYFLKRLRAGLRGAPLLPVAPPAVAPGREPPHAVPFADSS